MEETAQKTPVVSAIKLKNHYDFQYHNFLLADDFNLYMFLSRNEAVRFKYLVFKSGYPNDEVRHAHPLKNYGLDAYGLFEVENSPWIEELKNFNKIHPRHQDSLFADHRHFIAGFKDQTLEVIAADMQELHLKNSFIKALVKNRLKS